jgi:hypothetical protein
MQQTHYYTTGTATLPWKCNMLHRSCYQGKPNMSQYIYIYIYLIHFTYFLLLCKIWGSHGSKMSKLFLLWHRVYLQVNTNILEEQTACIFLSEYGEVSFFEIIVSTKKFTQCHNQNNNFINLPRLSLKLYEHTFELCCLSSALIHLFFRYWLLRGHSNFKWRTLTLLVYKCLLTC